MIARVLACLAAGAVLAAAPAEKELVPVECPDCEGSGLDRTRTIVVEGKDGGKIEARPPCARCGGKGKVMVAPREAKRLALGKAIKQARGVEESVREAIRTAPNEERKKTLEQRLARAVERREKLEKQLADLDGEEEPK